MTMQFSLQELRALVAVASSIDERLHYQLRPESSANNAALIQKRWEDWCQVLTKGNWSLFQRRLAWDHLDEGEVQRILGTVQWPDERPLPTWVEMVQAALCISATSAGQNTAYPFYDPAHPLPFEQLLAPFVRAAGTCLFVQVGPTFNLLGAEAHVSLQRELLKTLTSYAAPALQLEFSLERSLALSSLDRLMAGVEDEGENECYLRFVEHMQRGGLLTFLQEYAVLARQLGTMADLWVEFLAEFLQRLAQDQEALQQMLSGGKKLGQISAINAHLSDPHNGRRSVLALTFAGGQKVVYKPKDLGIEEAFQQLLRWVNAHDQSLALKTLRILCRPGYGWVEFVEHKACEREEEARRYFQRMGMLLCLVYVLEGTDCHNENLIACGENPVLVDSEALMQPRQRDDLADGVLARVLAQQQLLHSVLRTGMLPNWLIDGSGQAHDISALGGMHLREITVQSWTWEQINTDQMERRFKKITHPLVLAGPMLGNQALSAEKYSAEIISGLQRMYHFLQEQREHLLAADCPLAKMAQQPVRFIYRNTLVYTTLLRKLCAPEFQRDGVSRSIQLELLGRAVLPEASELEQYSDPSSWWPIFANERWAMQQEDIPYYSAQPTSDALLIPQASAIPGLFQGPSFELVAQRLRALDQEDLEKQVGLVAGAFYTQRTHRSNTHSGIAQSKVSWDASERQDELAVPTSAELVGHALRIAEQIQRRAIRANKSAIWIAPQLIYRAERYQLQPLNEDLYSGLSGVALFLAAASKAADSRNLRDLALEAIFPLRQSIQECGDELANAIGIGGAAGLGSLLFTFAHLSQSLDEPMLLQDARKILGLMTDERIEADTNYDIIYGSAGAILALLALYDRMPGDSTIIERAEVCAAHLMRSSTPTQGGQRAWATIGNKMLAGFSHGVAGIAYALLRLYTITGNHEYRLLASESIDYERSLFLPEQGNWRDLRSDAPGVTTSSWCHGAPGIGLGRIGGLMGLDNQQVRGDIDLALAKVCSLPLAGIDHVCCGNMGLADILLTAAQRLQRPELRDLALCRARQVLARAQANSAFIIDPQLPNQLYTPGFFQGTAGIGYTCLRLAQQDSFSSVLLWE